MSSHREAPEISKDPVADSTDLYAFVSPDKPGLRHDHRQLRPLQDPDGGPNFFEFGDDVLYEIHISNAGDAQARHHLRFRFHTVVCNKKTFLYNTGQITSIYDPHFNRRQYYTVTRTTRNGHTQVLGTNLACPPCNIGPRSTPNYEHLAAQAVHTLPQRRHGLRRPARRRIPRRPRLGVRPARPAPVPEPAPHPDRRRRPASTRWPA